MISMRACGLAAALLLTLGYGTAANAAPVMLEYTGVISSSFIPGAAVNDTVTLQVFADNGNTGLLSQSWSASDVTKAIIQVGSYSATATGAHIFSAGTFTTDALGQLATLAFMVQQNGSDTNGGTSFWYILNGTNGFWYDMVNSLSLQAFAPPTIGNTTISQVVATTPVPATLPLLASALAGLGFVGWRRKRAAAAA